MGESVIAYDFDGVLAVKPTVTGPAWSRLKGHEREARKMDLLTHYMAAEPLLRPEGKFHVITARKSDANVVDISLEWLDKHYPNQVEQVHFLDKARTMENVINFKARILHELGAAHFTEDNKAVLRGLAVYGVPAQLWFWKSGMIKPVKYEGGVK